MYVHLVVTGLQPGSLTVFVLLFFSSHLAGFCVHLHEHVPLLYPAGFQRALPHDARRTFSRYDGLQPQEGGIRTGQQPRATFHRLTLFMKCFCFKYYIRKFTNSDRYNLQVNFRDT